MITSSINEFLNPAYNGPSALDEGSTADGRRAVTNGDYAKAKILDFDLITETRVTPDMTDSIVQETSAKDDKGGEVLEDSSTGTTEDEDAKYADKIDRELEMEVRETTGTSVSDMDVDMAVANMDGIETEGGSKDQDEQNKSSDIQVDGETDGGMDVDVDQS